MIRVVVAGTSSFGLPSFTALLNAADVELVGVISQPARPLGRHQTITLSPVAQWAADHRRQLLAPNNWKQPPDLQQLRDWQPDLLVVASYGIIVPDSVLRIPRLGCLNIHASILPAYRGASPIAAAILNGDTATGVTFMMMDEGLDTGSIVANYSCPIQPDDTTPSLTERLAAIAAEHINDVVTGLAAGTLTPQPQPDGATYAKKITRADGRATWTSARLLERKTRAYAPWPGLWTTWRGQTIKLLTGRVVSGRPKEPSGTVIRVGDDWGIACDDGIFQPDTIQFEGKKPQSAKTVLGSYPGFLGAVLND